MASVGLNLFVVWPGCAVSPQFLTTGHFRQATLLRLATQPREFRTVEPDIVLLGESGLSIRLALMLAQLCPKESMYDGLDSFFYRGLSVDCALLVIQQTGYIPAKMLVSRMPTMAIV